MKKLWIPLSYGVNDTQAMSELFERFAKKGWHFDKLYGTGVLFIKGEKQACAYAVDLFSLKRNSFSNIMIFVRKAAGNLQTGMTSIRYLRRLKVQNQFLCRVMMR